MSKTQIFAKRNNIPLPSVTFRPEKILRPEYCKIEGTAILIRTLCNKEWNAMHY